LLSISLFIGRTGDGKERGRRGRAKSCRRRGRGSAIIQQQNNDNTSLEQLEATPLGGTGRGSTSQLGSGNRLAVNQSASEHFGINIWEQGLH